MEGSDKQERFEKALSGKKIPVLTLDGKWYRLLDELGRSAAKESENQLNSLLRRQGKLNAEIKDIKKLKKKLMNEMLPMVDEANAGNEESEKKIEEQKRLIEECNQKIDANEDELLDIPRAIEEINYQLMLVTMEYCYKTMQENTVEINEQDEWISQIRVELKKRLIRKQEMEQKNHEIYSYMHDIFGAEVVNIFDMTYNPEEKHPVLPGEKKDAEKAGED